MKEREERNGDERRSGRKETSKVFVEERKGEGDERIRRRH